MAASMLAESDIAADERRFAGREFGSAEIFLAEEAIERPGSCGCHEHALGIGPAIAIRGAYANEHGARRAQCDEFV